MHYKDLTELRQSRIPRIRLCWHRNARAPLCDESESLAERAVRLSSRADSDRSIPHVEGLARARLSQLMCWIRTRSSMIARSAVSA